MNRRIHQARQAVSFFSDSLFSATPHLAYTGGYLGYGNLGDEALFAAYRKLFPEYGMVRYPGGRKVERAANGMLKLHAGVLAGGTLIGRAPKWLRPAEEVQRLTERFFVFGTGVADPEFWQDRLPVSQHELMRRWKPVLEKAVFTGVRGPRSAELLTDLGIRNVEVVGDPVIVFTDEPAAGQGPAFSAAEAAAGPASGRIGLNLGTSNGHIWGGDEERIIGEFSRLASLVKTAGLEVEWFVVQKADLRPTLRAAAESGTERTVHRVYRNWGNYLTRSARLDAFAGMKLHAVALATVAAVPSLMVEYRPKCRDYMRSLELEEYVVRSSDFTAGAAWERLQAILARGDEESRHVAERVGSLRRRQEELRRTLVSRLQNG